MSRPPLLSIQLLELSTGYLKSSKDNTSRPLYLSSHKATIEAFQATFTFRIPLEGIHITHYRLPKGHSTCLRYRLVTSRLDKFGETKECLQTPSLTCKKFIMTGLLYPDTSWYVWHEIWDDLGKFDKVEQQIRMIHPSSGWFSGVCRGGMWDVISKIKF